MEEKQILLKVSHVKKYFHVKKSINKDKNEYLHAVDDVSFTLNKGDVLIGISASGASRRLVGMARIAQKRGALVVTITNQPESPLAENSDIVLTTASRERVFYDQVSFTRSAAMAVVDSIFLLLYSMRKDSFQQLLEHEQIISEDKI